MFNASLSCDIPIMELSPRLIGPKTRHLLITEDMEEPEPDPFMTEYDDSFEFVNRIPEEYTAREHLQGRTISTKASVLEGGENTLRQNLDELFRSTEIDKVMLSEIYSEGELNK